ncbi:MAG: FlaA1/EpsC-like NDP-sugar epimerase [Halieaceae bacterium]
MRRALVESVEKGFELPRNIKQAFLLSLDMVFVVVAMWSAIALRLGDPNIQLAAAEIIVSVGTILISAIVFLRLGLYRAVIRFMGQQAIWAVIRGVSYSALGLAALIFFTQAHVPRSLPFIYWGLALFAVGGSRLSLRAWYLYKLRSSCEKVVIYGAGESGRQLLTALLHGEDFHPVFFVDDDPKAQHRVINGVTVHSPTELPQLIDSHDITQILLAIPSVTGERRKAIINSLVNLPVYVRTVPYFNDLLQGTASVAEIKDIALEDLLGRDPVPPHPELMERCITGKVVMVTGAGGSIGAELCRQIMVSGVRELILFDNSEYALYRVEEELRSLMNVLSAEIVLIPLLGSVQDPRRLRHIFSTFEIDTVYHAAAYKHVPMVEYNVAEGVRNNVLGTWYAAEAAIEAGVENFVLISTDKAVRPTNVMGASKRFAEMLLQALARETDATRFCMVRFGNVLGSSGSVVPLFREQIERGKDLTVTHPDVSRYFMTIPEAAQLVLQASAMGLGGDVFVLDMGEPVRIQDLARRMIQLTGHEVKDENNPDGDIGIVFTGLRPGEKLFEELLLGHGVSGTGHPMIMRADEEYLEMAIIKVHLAALEQYCEDMECNGIRAVLLEAVSGFDEHQGLHDHVWQRQRQLARNADSNVKPLFPAVSSEQ